MTSRAQSSGRARRPAPRPSTPPAEDHTAAELARARHALRTPINHILGYCDMLLEEPDCGGAFRRDLERIQGGGKRLLNLVGEHFTELTWGKQPEDLHRLYHDLRTPVNHVVGYCELLEEEAEGTRQSQFIPELRKIHDAALTWLGLMEKYLKLHSAGPAAAEATPVVAAPAERAGGSSRRPGHHGVVTRSSVSAGQSLLIVDDDQDNRDLLARRLQRHGYQVAVAANGREALELLKARSFDLVLLDLIMPGVDGLEVLANLRERRSMSEVPVIVLTALDSSREVVEALELGANDFLTKPVDFAVVRARTETQLGLKQAQTQLKAKMEEVRKLAADLEKHNRFIRQVFGRYVTDAVVQNLLETPEGLHLGGEKRQVSILMSDLRGFTTIAERLAPEQVVQMINVYLGEMTGIISQFNGVIDEFIGDAILAIFGAPVRDESHAEHAVACAVAMQLAMAKVNEQLASLETPRLAMGIGVNTGPVVVGNIGSVKRAKFGVVGTPVNLASRIQATAAGGEVLVTEATAAQVGHILSLRERRVLAPKGFSDTLTVYAVGGLGGTYNLRLPPKQSDPPQS